MGYITFILVVIFAVVAYIFYKGFSNTKYSFDENEFRQANVVVNFNDKTINIKGKEYDVNQLKGMRTKHFESTKRHGNSKAVYVIIEVNDFEKPIHKVLFVTSGHAEKFIQRITTAIEKANETQ